MARRSVTFDFLQGRNTVSAGAKKVAHDLDNLGDHAGRAGNDAGRKFRKGLGDGLGDGKDDKGFQNLLKKLVTPNPELFESLKHTMARSLSTPLGLGIAAALTTALLATIPSAIALGLGGGLVAIGAFALRGSKVLKEHFKAAGSVISESLRQAAQPLKGPFLQAIETVTGAMKQLQPQFRGLFSALKPGIQPLVDGMVGLVRNALPGLQAAMPAVVAAFREMGARLPGLGATFGDFMRTITSNLPAIERGVGIFFNVADAALKLGAAIMRAAQMAAGGLPWIIEKYSQLEDLLPGVDKGQKAASASAGQLANDQGHLAIAAQKAATAHQAMLDKAKATKLAFYQERAAVASVIPVFDGYSNKSTVTKGKVLANLREELAAYKGWAQNTQTLLKRGADPAVVKALSDKGPQYVAAFVHASDSELADLNSIFKGRTQAAGSVATAAAGVAGGAMGRAATAGFAANFHPNLRVGAINPGGGGKGGRGASGKGRRSGKAMAGGGILHEPVAGIGLRSGTRYLMAERGPEAVVPLRGGRGGGAVTIIVNGVTDPRAVALKVRDELVRHQGRNGTTGLR